MKKNFRLSLRKLLSLLAVVSLLVSLAGCFNNTSGETEAPPSGTGSMQSDPTEGTEATEATDAPADPTEPPETTPVLMGTVTHDNLNVRSNASTEGTILVKLKANTRVVILEQKVVGDVTWGRIEQGWVNMNYVLLDGEDVPVPPIDPVDDPTEPPVADGKAGTVTAETLNIREKASADSKKLGQYKKGDKIILLEVQGTWGRTDKGWVSMNYVKTDGTTPEIGTGNTGNQDDPDDKTASTLVTDGKTKVLGYVVIDISSLNVRYGPGTSYNRAAIVRDGERYAYYQEKSGWLRIKSGWISKAYTEVQEPLTDKEASTLVTDGKTKVLGTVTIEADELNVRYGPSTEYNKVTAVKEDTKHDYFQEKNGWVRIKDGWVSLAYTDKEPEKTDDKDEIESDGKTKVLGYGVVTAGELNVRKGPGTKYDDIDEYGLGKRVAYYQKDGNWVRTKDGWVSTNYLYIEGNKGTGAGSGTVDGDGVNIRTGPGTDYKSTGKVNTGDKVSILYQLKVGKITWGFAKDKGWISMEYVKIK